MWSALLIACAISFQKLESQMRDIAYGTKQYKAPASEVEECFFFLFFFGWFFFTFLRYSIEPGPSHFNSVPIFYSYTYQRIKLCNSRAKLNKLKVCVWSNNELFSTLIELTITCLDTTNIIL